LILAGGAQVKLSRSRRKLFEERFADPRRKAERA
jgi:hypothetical protein